MRPSISIAAALLTHAGALEIPKPPQDRPTEIIVQIGHGSVADLEDLIVWDEVEVEEPPALPPGTPQTIRIPLPPADESDPDLTSD